MPDTSINDKQLSKREQVLSQAVDLFNDRGYNDTRLEDIAGELGKVKTSVSYHFKSKEALFNEALSRSCAFKETELDAASKQKTGLDRILYFIRSRAELHALALSGRIPPVQVFSDIEVIKENADPGRLAQFEAQIDRLRGFIVDGLSDGSINIQSPEAGTFYLMNIAHWLPAWLPNIPNSRHASAIDGLCDVLRNGLATDPKRMPGRSILRSQSDRYPAIFDRSVRNQLKRDAFLRTGMRFLNQSGFRNLSLNDVAGELGVSRGAFYYYIADKDALLESCFERTCETITEALEEAKRSSHHDHLDAIEHCLRILFEGHITELNPLVRLKLLNAVDPTKRIAIEAKFKRIRASFAEAIADAMVEGSVRTIDLDALENILMGLIFAANRWRLDAMPLTQSWNPTQEPIAASASYFQPLLTGFASKN